MMKSALMLLLTFTMQTLNAQTDAPWAGSVGNACFSEWEEQAVAAMNSHVGNAAFNQRKPWRLDEFGRLRGRGDPADYAPENYGRYNEDRYRFMWDYYEHALREPGRGWLMPEMEAAGVPPLREYVNECRQRTEPEPPVQTEARTFFTPTVGRYRLDWCLHWASGCGEPAADRFCREQGFEGASLWEIDIDVANRTNTYIIGDDRTCDLPTCDGFRFIACRATPPSTAPSPTETGFQRFGADYRVFTPSPDTPEACRAACRDEGRCQAWTFEQDGDARCRLKHTVTPPTPDPCCVSGVRDW